MCRSNIAQNNSISDAMDREAINMQADAHH